MNKVVRHYEECLAQYGDTHQGVDWPTQEGATTRYRVMLDVVEHRPAIVLDFGCGCAHLLDHIHANGVMDVQYLGYDISDKFLAVARKKYPGVPFWNDWADVPEVDYLIANGVFTEKCSLTFGEMVKHFMATVQMAFSKANIGMAFNVMSTHVDWKRDDLFHVSMDWMAEFLIEKLTRHFTFRNDYGMYEYTVYVYKESVYR